MLKMLYRFSKKHSAIVITIFVVLAVLWIFMLIMIGSRIFSLYTAPDVHERASEIKTEWLADPDSQYARASEAIEKNHNIIDTFLEDYFAEENQG